MNRRKISAMLAVALITTQVQGVTFADTKNGNQENNKVNEVVVGNSNESNSDSATEKSEDNQEGNLEKDNKSEESNGAATEDKEQTEKENTETEKEENNNGEEKNDTPSEKEDKSNETQTSTPYKVTGKLELDVNFASPIKVADSSKTNFTVKLTKGKKSYTVNLGSDVKSGKLDNSEIAYTLEALDYRRNKLSEGATELNFYHLTFENLELGTYSVEISGDGYQTVTMDNVEIEKSSKRILVGTDEKNIESEDGTTEHYPAALIGGDFDSDNKVDKKDYEALKNAIKSKSTDTKFDLNRDGKVDITDLSYVHKNMDKVKSNPVVVNTTPIINPENVDINLDKEKLTVTGDIKNILKDSDDVVSLQAKGEISEENPIEIPMSLTGKSRAASSEEESASIEEVVIQAPSENAPSSGEVVIPGAGENGQDLTVKFNDSNVTKSAARTADGTQMDTIKINLGKQVAVSQVNIRVTGSRSNKNLTEIAKVEFLNNVYKEVPKPKMNIPVINNFTSSTAVGNEAMTIGWNHETNVSGYELKVEELDNNNNVVDTSTYKTSQNSLKIEKVKPYGIYRISIQSISGEWKSGYKDEQEGYSTDTTGNTNKTNNSNDKDGKPDNVDANYNPQAWDSKTGILTEKADGDNGSNFGADSIIEVQVIPETAPEGPEGISVKGGYKQLTVSWKAHAKAKDYELYYREVGTKEWLKANDNGDKKYKDSNLEDDIPTGVTNLKAGEADSNDFIRATSYTITNLKDTTSYEIMMTATNHHGTGGLSQRYLGTTAKLVPPVTPNYKLINTPNGVGSLTNNIEKVEFTQGGTTDNDISVLDNDYTTAWTWHNWDTSAYGKCGPKITFKEEHKIDTIKLITRLDLDSWPYTGNIGFVNSQGNWEYRDASLSTSGRVVTLKLSEPITTKQIQPNISVYPGSGSGKVNISEIKLYEYDSLEKDVDNLFADDLKLSLNSDVTREKVEELVKRVNTIDPVNLEYHPNKDEILKNLQRAQDLLNDISLQDEIITLDSSIHSIGAQNTIGQTNDYQALGIAVKPGEKVNIYIASPNRSDTKFNLVLTQFNAESGTAYKVIKELKVGKNEIEIPETGFDMNYEKGGNLYIGLKSGFAESNTFKVRVSGGTKIPHLNVNNIIDDASKETEVKDAIRKYIKDLKSYVSTLKNRYPSTASIEDNVENIYTYDPKTSILNATDIEGERIMLSFAADKVLSSIESGLSGNEEAQVNRLYETLLAWEQIMKISYSQQGLLEAPIDFDGDGQITGKALDVLGGKSENQYYNENRAPKNRMNIKYQRMFTGAFMYASSHHVGIGYGSIEGAMNGTPFKFDSNGNLTNPADGSLFGWGIAHEIGHVHDRPGLTYAETTNNILALITQTFNDINESRLEGGTYEKIYDKVTSNSVGLASDGGTRLGMFWQLHLAYDNDYTYKMLDLNSDKNLDNDTFYAKLYRETRLKGVAPNENGHDSTAQTFIMRASDAVKKDLRGFFEKWGLVASPKTNEYLNSKNYPKEDKAIYYLNDDARRIRLKAGSNTESITMASDTKVDASFGVDANGTQLINKSYLNQKEVPLTLSVTKDADKILGYEIIRKEATTTGTKEVVVGFVERDKNGENGLTKYTDVIDAINNRAFEYKVRAYDYNLNVTQETTIGNIKVNHDGSISEANWTFDTNTRSDNDITDENSGHGQAQNGEIKKISDNDPTTIYTAKKATNNNGTVVSGDPYVTIDLGNAKSVVGLKYNPGQAPKKKFSLRSLFSKNSGTDYSPIRSYEVWVSKDGKSWSKAHSGEFDTTKENTIYFNENGSNSNTQLWAYDAQYVKLVAKGANAISIGEIDILGPTGDNIEIGIDNGNKVYEHGVGKLATDYTYAPGKTIPAGSIIVTGEYKGDPAFNVPLVINEADENFALNAQAILLATLPENSQLGEVAKGTWLYWITPEQQKDKENIKGTKIKAELYRYNKLDSNNAPVGQRLVSDTFLYDLPTNLENLPSIELNNSTARAIANEYDEVIEISNDMIQNVFNNR